MSHIRATFEVPPSRSITRTASRSCFIVGAILGPPKIRCQGPPKSFFVRLASVKTWNKRITERRTALTISKAEFARRVGVSGATVTDWENGVIKTIGGQRLLKAAEVLKVSPEWLLSGRGEPEPADQASAGQEAHTEQATPYPELLAAWELLTQEQRQSYRGQISQQADSNRQVYEELSQSPPIRVRDREIMKAGKLPFILRRRKEDAS